VIGDGMKILCLDHNRPPRPRTCKEEEEDIILSKEGNKMLRQMGHTTRKDENIIKQNFVSKPET
jgi:hypothetical protein